MRPSPSEQLDGICRILAEIVGPAVGDAYAAETLDRSLASLRSLAEGWAGIDPFLRWDSEQTTAVLRLAGEEVEAVPAGVLDHQALAAHHRRVRGQLEASLAAVVAHEEAHRAMLQLFRDRAARWPLDTRR